MAKFPCYTCLVASMCKQKYCRSLVERTIELDCEILRQFVDYANIKEINKGREFFGLCKIRERKF